MPLYQPGDLVRLSTTFTVDDTPTDPTSVTLTVQKPDGTQTDYVHGTDPEVVKDSTGVYHADIEADQAGLWVWAWTGTGAAHGVDEGSFSVSRRLVSGPALVSVDQVKRARRDATQGQLDDLIQSLAIRASDAIMDYTGRNMRPLVVEERIFDFDRRSVRSRSLRVDDLVAAPTAGALLDEDGEVSYTLTLPGDLVLLPRNREPWQPIERVRLRPDVPAVGERDALRLTGTWGWPEIPGFVEEAVIETVVEWLKAHQAVTQPSPDQFEPGTPPSRGLPLKARKLLDRVAGPEFG